MTLALILFVLFYILMLAVQQYRPWVALGGAGTFLLLGKLGVYDFTLADAARAVDFNVLLMMAGMMGTVFLFIQSKMPARLAEELIAHVPDVRWAVSVLALLAGYGKSRRLLRVSLVFFAVSAAFGGGVFALQLLGGRGLTLQNGIFYSAMDLRLILLSAAGCYVLITLLFQRTARHSGLRRELVPAVLTLEGRRVALTALVDTGNPATGRPVMVAEGEKVGALFPDGQAPAPEELRRPVEALERLGRQGWQGRCRLLPYQAVGVECGMLLAVRMDRVQVGKEDYGGILVALSPTRISDGGGYSALIGA